MGKPRVKLAECVVFLLLLRFAFFILCSQIRSQRNIIITYGNALSFQDVPNAEGLDCLKNKAWHGKSIRWANRGQHSSLEALALVSEPFLVC